MACVNQTTLTVRHIAFGSQAQIRKAKRGTTGGRCEFRCCTHAPLSASAGRSFSSRFSTSRYNEMSSLHSRTPYIVLQWFPYFCGHLETLFVVSLGRFGRQKFVFLFVELGAVRRHELPDKTNLFNRHLGLTCIFPKMEFLRISVWRLEFSFKVIEHPKNVLFQQLSSTCCNMRLTQNFKNSYVGKLRIDPILRFFGEMFVVRTCIGVVRGISVTRTWVNFTAAVSRRQPKPKPKPKPSASNVRSANSAAA